MTGFVARQMMGSLARFLGVFLLAGGLLGLLTSQASAAQDFGAREAGRHVYDRAGVLTAAQVSDLETRAAATARAGAPTIIYLRVQKADAQATSKDARELMDAWDVQSAPDARDGIVIFLNLKPGDTRHGQAALWVGGRHTDGGNLPQHELDRIYDRVMRPRLSDGQTAAGIGAGLDALTTSLTVGPPPPPPPSTAQRVSAVIAGLPLNILAIVGTIVLGLVTRRTWQGRPKPAQQQAATLARPNDLPPALAGALVTRQVSAATLAGATLLDLAQRGKLALQPEGAKGIGIRLLTTETPQASFERALWVSLAHQADADGVITAKRFKKLAQNWPGFAGVVRDELIQRGWLAPEAKARRMPLYIGGTVAFLAALLAVIPVVIGKQPWGIPAIVLLLAAGLTAMILAAMYPSTTAAGEQVGAPWRGYAAGLKGAARDPTQALDLDRVLPDAVAFGITSTFDRRIKDASAQGYVPSWFLRQHVAGAIPVAFYPYWLLFHASASSSSTTATGGGASSGGAGAGGNF